MNIKNRQFHLPIVLLVLGFLLMPLMAGANTAPEVSNVQVAQRVGTFLIDITYDLYDAEGDPMWVSMYFSPDGGATWPIRCASVIGDANTYVTSGSGYSVAWDSEEDYPGLISDSCAIRIIAEDRSPYPFIDTIWKTDLDGGNQQLLAMGDTLGFGHSFRLHWTGQSRIAYGMDPQMLSSLDTVHPFDDGLLGFKYNLLDPTCVPSITDCWNPQNFDNYTGDYISYFGPVSSLAFLNDGSESDRFHELLPSGEFEIKLNTIDVAGMELPEQDQLFHYVINFDPETIMLDGETDWAHPEDPEVYPYYILLNDPGQIHHPFQSGDRIPDRTYVVVKALGRDDDRDLKLDENHQVPLVGYLQATRDNYMGGQFSFQTESSDLNPVPSWPANEDGWSADTLGFLTGPRSEFTINMQAVDEHGRRDGTPAALSFLVGYPPCIQCIEILPKSSTPSDFDENLACLEDTSPAALEAHPCFGDTTILRITQAGLGDDEIEFIQPGYLLVDISTGYTQVALEPGLGGEDNFEIVANIYRMEVLLHGLDDPRERWEETYRRLMGVQYQVDYECDPFNQIQDGGGNDNINIPTWGLLPNGSGLEIDATTGLWKISVDVAVPRDLILLGPENYRDIALQFIVGISDPELRERVFNDTTKQFGTGRVQAIALDQTQCGFNPPRPARYNVFRHVRPSVAELNPGMSWRDCNLKDMGIPDIMLDLDISPGVMASLDGVPASRYFRIIVETAMGDFECSASDGL